MRLLSISEYAIKCRIGRGEETGEIYQTRFGNTKRKCIFKELYETGIGEIEPTEWLYIALQIVKCIGEEKLLDEIEKYVKENCVWLKTDKDIQEYSADCLLSEAYMYWEKFKNKRIPEHKVFFFEKEQR